MDLSKEFQAVKKCVQEAPIITSGAASAIVSSIICTAFGKPSLFPIISPLLFGAFYKGIEVINNNSKER